ncbi:hypothetical protein MMC28_010555 [Mycoblastus sanguinarius]|nr:hypothetical protein [Mycoblastus sanguinarius]
MPAAFTSVSLCTLSREIRDHIYRHVFEPRYRLVPAQVVASSCHEPCSYLGILLASQMFYEEASIILYSESTFTFHLSNMQPILPPISLWKAGLMRKVVIHIGIYVYKDGMLLLHCNYQDYHTLFLKISGGAIARKSCRVVIDANVDYDPKPTFAGNGLSKALKRLTGFETFVIGILRPEFISLPVDFNLDRNASLEDLWEIKMKIWDSLRKDLGRDLEIDLGPWSSYDQATTLCLAFRPREFLRRRQL